MLAEILSRQLTKDTVKAYTKAFNSKVGRPGSHKSPVPLAANDPYGSVRASIYAVLTDPEHNPALRGTAWRGTPRKPGLVDKISRDDKVGLGEALRTAPLLSPMAIWSFKPHPRGLSVDIEHAKHCNMVLSQVKATLIPALLRFHRYGVGLAEGFDIKQELNRGEFPNHPTGISIGFSHFRELPVKQIHSFKADKNDRSKVDGFYLYDENDMRGSYFKLNENRVIRLTTNGGPDDFFGFGTYRWVYGPWYLRQFYRTIAAAKHDKFGLGSLVAKAPESSNDKDEAKMAMMLMEYRSNERATFSLPHGWDLGILGTLNSNGAIGTDVEAAMELLHRDVFAAWGSSVQTLGDTNFGSHALAGVLDGQLDNLVTADATLIAKAICEEDGNGWSFEKHLRMANYPTALPATLQGRNFPTKDYAKRAEVLTKAVEKGAIRGGKHIEKAILEGFGLREDEIEPWVYDEAGNIISN